MASRPGRRAQSPTATSSWHRCAISPSRDRGRPGGPSGSGSGAAERSIEQAIARLTTRFELPASASSPLATLLSALADPAAPTAIHNPATAIDVHLADSLVALEIAGAAGAPDLRAARSLADIGSGAGLPGLALAIALPNTHVVLIESNGRKAAWAAAAAEGAGLENVAVAHARAEEYAVGVVGAPSDGPLEPAAARPDGFDIVTARAVAALPVLVEYAAPLLRLGGALVAWKGAVEVPEAAAGAAAASELGLSAPTIHAVEPFAASERRTLWAFIKERPTPPGYPRRTGMAAKRPLTAPTLKKVSGSGPNPPDPPIASSP